MRSLKDSFASILYNINLNVWDGIFLHDPCKIDSWIDFFFQEKTINLFLLRESFFN